MGQFLDDEIYVSQQLGEKKDWRLRASLSYLSEELGLHVEAPKGFETDFASIPWFFRRLLPRTGTYNGAAVIHDFLCRCGQISRANADIMFREMMRDLNVKPWKIWVMYKGVRLGSLTHNPQPHKFNCKEGSVVPVAPEHLT